MPSPRSSRVQIARWDMRLYTYAPQMLYYETVQELPGADQYVNILRAAQTEPDELAALYDDSCQDIHMCGNLWALIMEDVTQVVPKLL